MVYQGGNVLWERLWRVDIHTLWHFLVHVLGPLWLLQPTLAILGFGALRVTVVAGACSASLFLALMQYTATQWKHPGVCQTAHPLLGMAHEQSGLNCDVWVVHLRRGVALELHLLQAMPGSLQAIDGSDFHSCCPAAHDSHCLLPLLPTTFPGRASSPKAPRSFADSHRFNADREILRGGF